MPTIGPLPGDACLGLPRPDRPVAMPDSARYLLHRPEILEPLRRGEAALDRVMEGTGRLYPAGRLLVEADSANTTIFRLRKGWVGRLRTLEDGRSQFILIFLPGDLFAVKSLFVTHSPDAIQALSEVLVEQVDHRTLREAYERDPDLATRCMWQVIEEERLRQNLLSSQPLCFNLFGPMKLDLALATAVCEQLLPGFIREVVDVRFEHSPARGHKAFVGDGTAFDVLLRGYTPAGRRAFVGIEVKLTEGCNEPLPRFSGCYEEIAQASGLFVDPGDPALRANPIQQLFRQTCLGAAMLRNELYDEGLYLLVAPQDNHLAWNAADSFRRHLCKPDAGRLPFHALSLETVISAIGAAGEAELARLLHRRHCDYLRIDEMLEFDRGGARLEICASNPSSRPTPKVDQHSATQISDTDAAA